MEPRFIGHINVVMIVLKKYNCKYVVYLLLFICMIVLHYQLQLQETNEQKSSTCSIVDSKRKNFKINIDGVVYPRHPVPLHLNASLDFDCMKKINKKPKLILFWNTWFGDKTFNYSIGKYEPFTKNSCPINNCETTDDQSRLKESNMVVVHMRDNIDDIPKRRNQNQQWIFLLYESPEHAGDYSKYDGVFNLSATYRSDSDFSSFYLPFDLEFSKNTEFNENKNYLLGKTGIAVMLVSNCGGTSKRMEYVKKMGKILPVRIIGRCGEPCPTAFDNGTAGDCKMILSEKYKFYFAFENSICKDYITEKLFDILRYNIVPVVYGYGPYESQIPKSAYINAMDFESPTDLANYLLYLDSNATAYNQYFKWKKYLRFTGQKVLQVRSICEMCIKLNIYEQYGVEKSLINNMDTYWTRKSDCKYVTETEHSFHYLNY